MLQRFAIAAMGTRFELVVAGGRGDLVAAGEAAIREIAVCHERLSRFSADSLVSHVARTPPGTPVRLERETFELFADAVAVWRASDGAFDITLAPAMAAHGYAPSTVAPGGSGGMRDLVLDEPQWTVSVSSSRAGLDFGAIAKGHALDLAGTVLREAGVTSALLHGGTSSVLAIGAPEGLDGWPVLVPLGAASQTVVLCDEALSVSCPASQIAAAGAAHIMDPRSAQPVSNAARVAVVGPSARLCDAWSTALAVLGSLPAEFPRAYRAIIGSGT